MTVQSTRPHYLEETLNSWARVRGTEEWLFSFHLEPGSHQRACVELIEAWEQRVSAVRVHYLFNGAKLGVLRNPWAALHLAFTGGASFVVLAEEDIVVSTDVLEYFARESERHEDATGVLAVCGSYFGEDGDPNEVYLAADFCPLLWGTWADRWNDVLRDTWDLDYSTGNPDGSEAGWDWNIRRRLIPQRELRCVWPRASRALHIGEHGGAHMQPEDFSASQAPGFVADR